LLFTHATLGWVIVSGTRPGDRMLTVTFDGKTRVREIRGGPSY
jgi:hypothetical protein